MYSAKETVSKSPGQVLVVDDEAGMRTALEVNFARRGGE